jgi:PHD/YefM family antitoxin component YafN of YafNO toxin-antitoxin module
MIQPADIRSLTDFQRNAKAHLRRLKKTGRPEVLTVNGKAAAVVQDPGAYQKLLKAVDRAEAIEGIRRGLEDVKHGRTRPLDDVIRDLGRRRRAS